jgi:hypothetical protein
MKINRYVRYKSLVHVELNAEDSIKVLGVTNDEIILSVNGKKITLIEYERQIDLNI